MKNKLVYICIITIIICFSSCSNFRNEPNKFINNKYENIKTEMSFDFEIDDENLTKSDTRVIPFLPTSNQNGYNHPNISIIMENSLNQLPITIYIYNDNVPDKNKAGVNSKLIHQGEAFVIKKWSYHKIENGKIKISIKKYSVPLRNIRISQLEFKGWKMRAVIGGELVKSSRKLNKKNIIKFGDNPNLDIITNGKIANLDIVYISDPIDIEYKKVEKKHIIFRSDKKNLNETAPVLKLKNKSMVLFYSIKENRLNDITTINGIKLKADNLSFKGYFSLDTGEYTSEDEIEDNEYMRIFRISRDFELSNPMTNRTPYLAIVTVPKKGKSSTNLSLNSLITSSLIPTKTIKFNNKPIEPNAYYSLGDNLYVENE